MRNTKILWLLIVLLSLSFSVSADVKKEAKPFGIVIHGGAGTMNPDRMSNELQEKYKKKLEEAMSAGYAILAKGGTSLDAVETAIRIMEDSPLFNAGKGAVFTASGTNEMDASIMDGKTLNAGAAAAVKHIKNPITLARLVMEKSKHVMLAGEGAEVFAKEQGLTFVPQKYFFEKRRHQRYLDIKKKEEEKKKKSAALHTPKSPLAPNEKFGTVGAAALDKHGNLAAGTSTGGRTYKKFGRVGDSPIIGAGTYANNKTCAVSATGHGEFFMRAVAVYDISALMEYKGFSLKKAAYRVVNEKLKKMGGDGGIIAIDNKGNVAMPFNTTGMYRGYMKSDGSKVVNIFKD